MTNDTHGAARITGGTSGIGAAQTRDVSLEVRDARDALRVLHELEPCRFRTGSSS